MRAGGPVFLISYNQKIPQVKIFQYTSILKAKTLHNNAEFIPSAPLGLFISQRPFVCSGDRL